MMRYWNQWTVLAVWALAMGGAWAVFVPSLLSAGTLAAIALGGPALVVLVRTLRLAHEPAPSFGQGRAAADAAEAAARVRK